MIHQLLFNFIYFSLPFHFFLPSNEKQMLNVKIKIILKKKIILTIRHIVSTGKKNYNTCILTMVATNAEEDIQETRPFDRFLLPDR